MGGGSKSRSSSKSVQGPSSTQSFYGNLSKMFTTGTPESSDLGGTYYNPATGVLETKKGVTPDPDKEGMGMHKGHKSYKNYIEGMGIQRLADGRLFVPENLTREEGNTVLEDLQAGIDSGKSDIDLGITNFGGDIMEKYGFEQMEYNSFFDAYTEGTLDSTSQGIVDRANAMINTPSSTASDQINQIYEQAGANTAFSIRDPALFTDVVTQITEDLPQPMIDFINDLLVDSSSATIEQELDNFANSLTVAAEERGDEFLEQTMSKFASELGTTSSGAVMNAVKEGAIELAKEINTQVTAARLQFLDTALKAQQTGVEVLNTLFGTAQAQQSMQLSKDIKEIELEATRQNVKIQSHVALQRDLNGYLMNQLGLTMEEYRLEQQSRIQKVQFFQNYIKELATRGPGVGYQESRSSQSTGAFQVGLDIGTLALAAATYASNPAGKYQVLSSNLVELGAKTVSQTWHLNWQEEITLQEIKVTTTPPPVYEFNYYKKPGRYRGVMATEAPWYSVYRTKDGDLEVDYNKLLIDFERIG